LLFGEPLRAGIVPEAKPYSSFNPYIVTVLNIAEEIPAGWPNGRSAGAFPAVPYFEDYLVGDYLFQNVLSRFDDEIAQRVSLIAVWRDVREFPAHMLDLIDRHIALFDLSVCSADIRQNEFNFPLNIIYDSGNTVNHLAPTLQQSNIANYEPRPKLSDERLPHKAGLFAHIASLFSHGTPLQDGNDRQDSREGGNPPIGRRFAELFIVGIVSWELAVYGDGLRARGRRGLGSILVFASACGYVLTLALWLVTGFHWSWGWYL
jgi:hypothetical protein